MRIETVQWERRARCRFGMRRELRYKLVKGRTVVAAGAGYTIDVGSGGVAFSADHELRPGAAVELSINWPVLLAQTCPIQLVVFGRVLRGAGRTAVCTVDKHEFRTARASRADAWVRPDATGPAQPATQPSSNDGIEVSAAPRARITSPVRT